MSRLPIWMGILPGRDIGYTYWLVVSSRWRVGIFNFTLLSAAPIMTWFEQLTGCREQSPAQVRQHLSWDGRRIHSQCNGQSWQSGELEIPSLAELRTRVSKIATTARPLTVREVVANVQLLHADAANANAMFQVASQFNLLEMTSPGITPEAGIGIYEHDYTQGPACAIAAGAGTIVRNYFVPVDGNIGQSANQQIDCLAEVGVLLGNTDARLWRMLNGYALPTSAGLAEINDLLDNMNPKQLDQVRRALRVGIQWETQVTLEGTAHNVSQIYCSAMPVRYTNIDSDLWEPLASLILDAAYEATLYAAILNQARTGSNQLYLTLLGGGAFGNHPAWILAAIGRAVELLPHCGLDVAIVSHGSSKADVRRLVRESNK